MNPNDAYQQTKEERIMYGLKQTQECAVPQAVQVGQGISAERPKSNTEIAFAELDHSVDYLHSRLGTLIDLLSPVLLPQAPTPANPNSNAKPSPELRCGIADRLYVLHSQVTTMSAAVNRLIERLDV